MTTQEPVRDPGIAEAFEIFEREAFVGGEWGWTDADKAEARAVLKAAIEAPWRTALERAVAFGQGWIDNGDFPGPQSRPQAELDEIAALLHPDTAEGGPASG